MKKKTNNPVALEHYTLVEKFLSSFPKKSKILDAGCGEGYLSQKLLKMGFNVYACDISAKKFVSKKIPFVPVDLNKKLPYKNNSFNVIVCLEVVEHLENPWLLLDEFYKILKNGGTLIISSPNISNCLARIYYLFTGKIWLFKEHRTDHINPVSFWEIKSILKKTNFRKVSLLMGVDVINNVDMVTKIKNPLIKLAYNVFFKTLGLIHNLLNSRKKETNIIFRSFSYIIHAKK